MAVGSKRGKTPKLGFNIKAVNAKKVNTLLRRKKMKKILTLILVLMLSLSVMAGCSTPQTAPETTEETPVADLPAEESTSGIEGTVALGGSTSVESVILSAMEVFMQENPGVTINYDPTGSSSGVKGALDGSLDIGLASRDVKDAEVAEGAMGTVFAIDGIAVIVNPENAVADLALADITGIADGSITNWSELGGADADIVLIGREAGSGTRDGFESIVGVEECVYQEEINSTGGVIASVTSNPNAIGYASLSAVDEKVKAVTVDGIEASEATVQDGTYAVQRNFNFVTITDGELSEAAKAFYDFVLSADAAELIKNAGAVPPVA